MGRAHSMVHRTIDPLTGALRDDVLVSREDAERLGIREGELIRLTSSSGSFLGRLKIHQIKPGNVEVHWPEGNCLLSGEDIDPRSREPDYNTVVTIERAEV